VLSDRESVELTHLHFVRLLAGAKDKDRYVVKGGCNLRFFFGSVRYSEDLDLDAQGGTVDALKDRVGALLASKPLREVLATAGIEITRVSTPKQTETTQRWKLELAVAGRDVPLHTKIEFSRRGEPGESVLGPVDARLVSHYRLMPVLACHYVLATAIRQKVGALVGRREVQARDVFDLSVLFAHAGEGLTRGADLPAPVTAAIDRVWEVSYADYRGQVVAYLQPEHAEALSSEVAWEAMQLQVVTALEGAGRSP
jgi:predicted nucleotidyltransferase component of viral defense system